MDDGEGPVVTGISPTVGLPGTKVTIRGENLGENKDDVIELTINGVSCLQSLEYHSSRKLVCLRPNAPGTGDIIVNTFSGGSGTCTVRITIQQPEVKQLLGPLEDADEWKEEDFDFQTPGFSTKAASPTYTRKIIDPLGGTPSISRRGSRTVDLKEMFPNASGDLLAENFNPVWFLLEAHRYTSFFDLKLGLRRLQREVEQSDQAPVQFMRDNLGIFLQSYDTLSDVNELLIRNESESQGGSLTDRVEELLRESARRAEEVFDGILKCKGRADATRNALNILQSHKVLFNLPRSIEKNIRAGDYDLVTSDYEKANVHMANTRVNIFRRVLEEVQHQIRDFRGELYRQLLVLPATLEEQKRLIKYLLELDCESDPAWECITNMHRWLLRLLFSSKDEFQLGHIRTACELTPLPPALANYEAPPPIVPPRIRGGSFIDRGHNRTMSDVSYASSASSHGAAHPVPSVRVQDRDISRTATGTRVVGSGGGEREVGGGSTVASRVDTSGRPSRILFVEDLTEIVLTNLPNFWRLAQAYFSHALFQGVSLLGENQQQLARNCGQNQPKFEGMIIEIMEVYTDMVNCSLFLDAYEGLSRKRKEKLGEWVPFDDDLLESSGYWLPQIVRQIRDCVNYLQSLDLPVKAVELTQQLAFNVRTLCSQTLFHRAARDIEVLHEREDWQVQSEEGGIVTSLPVLFENVVVEALLALKEIVIVKLVDEGEGVASEVHSRDNKELRDNTVGHFQGLWEHLLGTFDYLAFHWEEEVHQESSIGQGVNVAGNFEEGEFSLPNSDERLLIVMSNLRFVMNEVVQRLFTCFVNHGYPRCDSVQEDVLFDLQELDDKVFDEYIKRKSESIVGIIEQGIQVGNFDWEQCRPPTAVRNYIKEVLLSLVIIHAEVFAVSEHIVPRVLCRLIELVSDEFLRNIREVEVFGYNGIIYAYIELEALEQVLKPFINDVSRENFDQSREHLKEWDVHASESVTKIVDKFCEKSKLQLRCFNMTLNEEDIDDSEAV